MITAFILIWVMIALYYWKALHKNAYAFSNMNVVKIPELKMKRKCYQDLLNDFSPFNKSDNILMVSGEDVLISSMRDLFIILVSAGGIA